MKISTLLQEAPLPDDWDKSMFNQNIPFEERIKYGLRMARMQGFGTSRVAFNIPFEHRNTVLKIAKNDRGLKQNSFEIKVLSDNEVKQSKLFIPLIDFDGKNQRPVWLHTELAYEIDETDFMRLVGIDLHTFSEILKRRVSELCGRKNVSYDDINKAGINSFGEAKIKKATNKAFSLAKICHRMNIDTQDIMLTTNMGEFEDRLVFIDCGQES